MKISRDITRSRQRESLERLVRSGEVLGDLGNSDEL